MRLLWKKLNINQLSFQSPQMRFLLASSVIALFSLLFLVYLHINTQPLFLVKVGSAEIGSVSEPQVVKQWLEQQNQALAKKYPAARVKRDAQGITYEAVKVFRGKADNEQVLAQLDGMLETKAYGVQLVVDGKPIGIVKDEQTAQDLLAYVKERQLNALKNKKATTDNKVGVLSYQAPTSVEAENESVSEIQSVEFVEPFQLQDVEAGPDDIVNPAKLLQIIERGEVGERIYTIQEGDCISCIAQKFNIPPSLIYDNNPWIEEDRITAGDKLNLTVKKPLLSLRTIEKITEREDIHHDTIYENDATLRSGATRTVVSGQNGLREITMMVTKIGGEIVQEQTLKEEVLQKPTTAVIRRGTKIIAGEGSGKFMVPVKGATLSSRYGMRGGRLHKGVDFTSSNRNIYAADSGKVSFVGRQRGYGNTIVIDHRNGFQTMYAHLKSYKVRDGETVEKGDVIGIMGSTGNSDAVHLHFEIHKSGRVVNPSKYLSR